VGRAKVLTFAIDQKPYHLASALRQNASYTLQAADSLVIVAALETKHTSVHWTQSSRVVILLTGPYQLGISGPVIQSAMRDQ
jgi:hypothetical protein